ncbi:Hydroxycarboxylic acid receptor 2 [Oryzias melastigma]|uniref:Hydroxycarboxylic acid receptor 2 n=1 Tax=Oryzias melastigma TaxID=30732 RepID=A0A834BNS7_ORYME|nr:Hydroxycarboxylic acid receptor 2 [Oryzias melastigma]
MENQTCSKSQVANSFLQFVMILDLVVGLPGTIIALWIFCKIKKWKPHIIFLFNLVLADFLLLASVPFRIDAHIQGGSWRFGSFWCRVNLYMLSVNRSASIAFLTTVALNRYVKVVYPRHCISELSSVAASRISALIWVVVIAFRIPLLTTNLFHESAKVNVCRSFDNYKVIPKPLYVHYVLYIFEFVLPWLVLLFCSIRITCSLQRQRIGSQEILRKAIRAVMVITTVFTLCFMPGVVTGLGSVYINMYSNEDCKHTSWNQAFMIGIGFTYLHSALDPVIYFFSSSTFTQTFKNSVNLKRKRKEQRSALAKLQK